MNGQKSAGGYASFGSAALTLQDHLRARVTVVARENSSSFEAVGTLHSLDHVLNVLSEVTLRQFLSASRGDKMGRPTEITVTAANSIIEMHVHGPIDLQRDVRKVSALPEQNFDGNDIAALHRFSALNGLPLRWRGSLSASSTRREQALDRFNAHGLDAALWMAPRGASVDSIVLQPGKLNDGGNYRYELHEADFGSMRSLMESLGRGGFEITGLQVDDPQNQVNANRVRSVRTVVRLNDANPGPHSYALYRTQALRARLDFFERSGWEVCAYTRTRDDLSTTAEHILVAKASPDQKYENDVVAVSKSDEASIRNLVAARAANGWKLAGGHQDNDGVSLLFKRPSSNEEQVADPDAPAYHNDSTIMGDPIDLLPASLLFVTEDGYAFDVDELVDLIDSKGLATNPWTGTALSAADLQTLVLHPSGAGGRIAAMAAENDALMLRLKPAVADALRSLSAILGADDTAGAMVSSTNAMVAFSDFVKGLPRDEQVALAGARFDLRDTHNNPFSISIMGAIAGVQTHAGCSRATATYLTEMAKRIDALNA